MSTNRSRDPHADRSAGALHAHPEVAKQVGREILESRFDPAVWAAALARCNGHREETIAEYTRLRSRQLAKLHRLQKTKDRSFETRRITKCMGDHKTRESLARTIQDLLGTSAGRRGNFVKPKLPLLWLALLYIGAAGTIAAFCRLHAEKLPEFIEEQVVFVTLVSAAGVLWSALILRYFLPKRWIMLGWNSGLTISCNVVCLCSLLLGTKLIRQSMLPEAVALGERSSVVRPADEHGPRTVGPVASPDDRPGHQAGRYLTAMPASPARAEQ